MRRSTARYGLHQALSLYGPILPRGGGTANGGVLTTVSLRTVDGWYFEYGLEAR